MIKADNRYEALGRAQTLVIVVFIVAATWYFAWRLSTLNANAMAFSVALLVAELFGLLTAFLHVFMTWRLADRQILAPRVGHAVDVFITTLNEPAELVRKTILAARNMAYAHETWLLDDGNRPEMATLATELGVRYLARSDRMHAKAGNLNHALARTKGEFIAVFDADHAPHPHFLMRTLGYFRDEAVAFVQTPQDFYNLDSYQHRRDKDERCLWTEQSLFFRVIQRGKDYWNAAFFCGSCAVLRRSALESIGGFAVGTVTEDLHTSLRLHKKGFKSVYHAEPLAFGLAPSSMAPFLRQRIRWGQGAMQVWRQEGVLFARGLSLAQRLNYCASMSTYLDGWQKAFFYVAPAVVLLTGIMPIDAPGADFLLHFIPYYVLTFWVFEEVGRGYGRTLLIEQYNMARFAAFAWSTLFFFRRNLEFRVTPKGKTPTSAYVNVPQLAVLALNGVAIPIGIALFVVLAHLPQDGLIANVIWAAINALLALAVLQFTERTNAYRRREYRFPVPLIARMSGQHNGLLLTVDDISSAGCRLYGPGLAKMRFGEEISGQLLLPTAVLPFRARISAHTFAGSAENRYIRAVGCSFLWASPRQHDVLDLFLYGSDLQWTLRQLNDRIPTPLERLQGLVRQHSAGAPERVERWAAMMYTFIGRRTAYESYGLVSVPLAAGRVILFQPPAADEIRGRSVTFAMQQEFRLALDDLERLVTPIGSIYLCRTHQVSEDQTASAAAALTVRKHAA